MGIRTWTLMGFVCLISGPFSCGGDEAQAPPSSGGADASDAKSKLVAAFTTSACKRPMECQSPTASQCTPYTEQQVMQGLAGLSWSDAEIEKCTSSRMAVVACLDNAACPDIVSASACGPEKTAWLDACAPLLDALGQ